MTSAPQWGQVLRVTVADVAGAVVVPVLALGLAVPPVIPLVVFAPHVGQMAVPSASLAPQILHFGIVVSYYSVGFINQVKLSKVFTLKIFNKSLSGTEVPEEYFIITWCFSPANA